MRRRAWILAAALIALAPTIGHAGVAEGSLSSTGVSAVAENVSGQFPIDIWGSFVGTCTLQRATLDLPSSGWLPAVVFDAPVTFSTSGSNSWSESASSGRYRLSCALSSGTVNYRIGK